MRAANDAGATSADSRSAFFTPGGMDVLPPAYGDFRIRGIDVYQATQPYSGAPMYGYKPDAAFAVLCGGGTPTHYSPVRVSPTRVVCTPSGDPQQASYAGVKLDRDKETTVVVYVDVAGA